MKRALVVLVSISTSFLAGCSLDLRSNDAYCDDSTPCPSGQRCIVASGRSSGLCVLDEQADAGGMDGGTDAGDAGMDGGGCVAGEPCYFGPGGTQDVGTCRAGTIECVGDMAVCRGEVTPASDDATCDGTDEDCDGTNDEDAPPMAECAIAQPGVCAQGQIICHMGGYACRPVNEATPETCNTLDDDCDEVVDEDTDQRCYPPEAPGGCTIEADGSFTCTGVCTPGRLACDAGTPSCVGARVPEASDGCTASGVALDDDCDGSIDEDCTEPCTGASRECYAGPAGVASVGTCTVGTQTCSGGTWSACTGSTLPSVESCDNPGADDDCDGVDDDIEGVGEACIDESAMGVCRTGAQTCTGSTVNCVTPTPASMEACDGRDDDCDGSVDEAFDFMTDEDHCGGCGFSCGAGRTCCGGTCVDTTRSTAHCGTCSNGCSATEGCCGSACMDLLADPMNCGACGNACTGAQVCCGGACVDPRSDLAHCGGCGMACAGGQACCDGVCADPLSTQCTDCTMDCTVDQTCCAPSCVDTDVDPANCGSCGVACTGAADTCCGATCVDTDTDEGNCGSCGGTCGGVTESCCEGGCVDTDADVFHCGGCGIVCDPGDLCCGGTCVDPDSDAAHCGSCTTDCSAIPGLACSEGHCCPVGQTWCEVVGSCIALDTDEDHCGSCGRACAAGQLCCGGSCVNPGADPAHCGACGNACSGGTPDCCGGGCVNRETDERHCGTCFRNCSLTMCNSGSCI